MQDANRATRVPPKLDMDKRRARVREGDGFCQNYCRLHARAPALASLPFDLACSIRLETRLHSTD